MSKPNPAAMGAFSAEVPHLYTAAPDRVFRAWTDPASIKAWLAGGERAIADVRVDGLYNVEMAHEGRNYPHYGRYLRVEPPRVLEFTWVSEGTHGKESVVTITLTPSGDGGTELLLRHAGLPSPESAESHRGGWTGFAERLGARLAAA